MTATEDPGPATVSVVAAPSAPAAHFASEFARTLQLKNTLTDGQANTLYTQAYNLTEQGRFDEANVVLALIMMYRPDEPKFTLASAICFRRTGCYREAIRMFGRTLELQPDLDEPPFQIVECMCLLGLHDEADDLLEQIAEIARRDGKASALERAETLLELKKVTVQ